MPRILGVDIPNGKAKFISPSHILYGMGRDSCVRLCAQANVDPTPESRG